MAASSAWRGNAVVVCCLLAALLVAVPSAHALPEDAAGDPVVPGRCKPSTYTLAATMVVVGLPLARSNIEVNAESAKLAAIGIQDGCDEVYARIPRFSWSVVSAPPGQTAALTDKTLSPGVTLGGPGRYRIRLTACPSGCTVTNPPYGSVRVNASSREVTIDAVESIVLPPETAPIGPPSEPSTDPTDFSLRSPDASEQCLNGFGTGVVNPQWVTVNRFRGAQSYELVEGRIYSSRISSMDNFLNHESQDHIIALAPDPFFRRLLSTKPEFSDSRLLGIEWEVDSFPRVFRPTAGDRASVFGFWILDCGHDFYTEIHPPVGIAVERPRPVRIPTTFQPDGFPSGFGSNVIVPGIATDLYFSRRSGETTSNCSDTGLHQTNGFAVGTCIREPHPVNRTFTFTIYLPRSPQERVQDEAGADPPPVPLYTAVRPPREGPSGGGPDPTLRPGVLPGTIDVEVDLRGFTGDVYARRIEAAWAYAAVDNWGARRWRVRLDTMFVENDAEPAFDDGEWRVYFNTNNTHREWTQIMNCNGASNGCVDDNETVALDLATGRHLGDDPIVFPSQDILVHTTGYDDEVVGDSTGEVIDTVSQQTARLRCQQAACRHSSDSRGGGGAYELNYRIRPGPRVGGATLTPQARALFEAYRLRGVPPCPPLRPRCVQLQGNPFALTQAWDPDNFILRSRGLSGSQLPVFKPQASERFALTGIPTRDLRRVIRKTRQRNPAKYRRFLAQIRAEIAATPKTRRADLYPLVDTLRRTLPKTSFVRVLPPGFRPSKLRSFKLTEPSSAEGD